jgi:hypothetical protein
MRQQPKVSIELTNPNPNKIVFSLDLLIKTLSKQRSALGFTFSNPNQNHLTAIKSELLDFFT